jgi:hypothetical protein
MTSNYNAESRLRAIAMNAIREAMLVYGRWDRPVTDDDAARADTIFNLLHLQERSNEYEHAALVEEKQAPVSATIAKIADLLDDEQIESSGLTEAVTAKIALPKTRTKA